MNDVIVVCKELFFNTLMIHRLAINNLITRYKGNLLGIFWIWINPLIQIVIYAIVFGQGMRSNKPIDGVEFYLWLTVGYIMWNYISGVVTPGSRSILGKMGLITKMRFPVSITPAVTVLSELYIHVLLLFTVIIILLLQGFPITIAYVQIIYFLVSVTCFLYAFSLFNSAITTVFRDFQHIVYNFMRALFFFTPVVYQFTGMKGIMGVVMKLNPFTYIIEGYRDALLYDRFVMISSMSRFGYFWSLVLFLLLIGSVLHVKMRKNLLDYA